MITLEYPEFYLICCYVPNAQDGLKRIDYRCEFEDAMREYMSELDKVKPVIYCGDLNVAHNEIDLKNPGPNRGNAGFSDEERGKMSELLGAGFTDTFRYLYPETVTYSWWSYRMKARERNAGWRIDYFIISDRLTDKLKDAEILTDIYGSDHCPVSVQWICLRKRFRMHKFVTHDGYKISIDLGPGNEELIRLLRDTIPRLSYDEILDGELEKRLSKTGPRTVKLSSGDDVRQLIFSLAMFNTISKPPGF